MSFEVQKGEILGFLGPNGAGKTTTMRIITGFMPATSGTVRVEGFDVFEQSSEVRRRMGYLPENPPLYNDMSAETYLRFVARLKGMARGDISTALERVLETCGLTGVRDRLLGHLSKGYRQRVGLAQALLHDPPVLALAEPTPARRTRPAPRACAPPCGAPCPRAPGSVSVSPRPSPPTRRCSSSTSRRSV